MSEISPLRPFHLSISCAGAFPVRTSAQPARAPDWRVSDPGCFSRWPGSFASYAPESSSWRTSQRLLVGGFQPYSGRWPLSGMMRGGEVCEHQRWAHRTGGSGGSVSRGWPTPDSGVFNYSESPESFDARARKRKKQKRDNGNGNGKVLAVEVKRWPTPTVGAATGGQTTPAGTTDQGRTPDGRKVTIGIAEMVRRWPTMTASEAKRGHGYQRAQGRIDPTLTGATGAAQAWPTPTALSNNRPTGSIQEWGGSGGNKIRQLDPALARGRLNPAWVETLQGFPEGWSLTDGPPLRDHSTHGSHRAPDHDSPMTETD